MNVFLEGAREGFLVFGEGISSLINSVLLSIVYIFGVGTTSLIMKIFGKRFLEKDIPKKSYWKGIDPKKKEIDDYYRQY
jgi:hypothetical protein